MNSEKRWIQTISDIGGSQLAQLRVKVEPAFASAHTGQLDRQFYNLPGGVKSTSKLIILNDCYNPVFTHWRVLIGKEKEGYMRHTV